MRILLLLAPLALTAQTVEFNREIRPILSDRCYSCHGPDSGKRQANLRLDRENGPAVIEKVLVRIKSPDKTLRMPPAYFGHDALKPAEIAVMERWAAQGAKFEPHWSFIPPRKREVPPGVHAIDYFIGERLRREGLRPSPPADRKTLIRRVTLDLTGLPPSPDDLRRDETDEQLVDRLLSSKRYAERMAIRWLEAARYADTNGYQSDGERSMWRWRDWVLNAFDRNMPFDQFTIEQLAGDLLPDATRDQIVATGFHRNHRTSAEGGIIDEEFRVEYVADRAETTATVWLGLTIGCARCHDHKYDPLSQKEFYQLFAFFNQVPEKGFVYNFGNEEPYIKAPTPEMESKLAALDGRLAGARDKWQSLESVIARKSSKFKPPQEWLPPEDLIFRHPGGVFSGGDGVSAGHEKTRLNYLDPFTFAATVTARDPNGAILSKSEDYWEGTGHGLYLVDGKIRLHVVFRWTDLGLRLETVKPLPLGEPHRLIVTYDGRRKPSGFHIYVDGVEQELKTLFNELSWPMDSKDPFRIGAGGGKRFNGEIRDVAVWKRVVEPVEFQDRPRYAWLDLKAPVKVKVARSELRDAQRERDQYYASIPTVMVMQDAPAKRDTFLLKRGAYDAPGEKVEAGVPAVLPQPLNAPRNRLDLARWLVSRDNPLTARVVVNRLWQMLFGTGLVKTAEDFGSQGEWPVHAELLDWLAVEFMDSGWNLKHILKTIVMSQTYQQSSRVTPELLQRDPENRLYGRSPRLRLPHEMIRDQALAASGLLVEKFGGPSVKPAQPAGLWQELAGGSGYKADQGEGLYRRSLYTYWRRTIQPPSMITFDSPTRETCAVRETRTNTPLQALNLMNDPAYVEASRRLGERMAASSDPVREGTLRVLAREPRAKERELLQAAYRRFGKWDAVASILLNLDEAVTKE